MYYLTLSQGETQNELIDEGFELGRLLWFVREQYSIPYASWHLWDRDGVLVLTATGPLDGSGPAARYTISEREPS